MRCRGRIDFLKLEERIVTLEREDRFRPLSPALGRINGSSHSPPTEPLSNFLSPTAGPLLSSINSSNTFKAYTPHIEVRLNPQAMREDFSLTQSGSSQHGRDTGSYVPLLSASHAVWLSTDQKGQPRYFGYTSNMQVVLTVPLSLPALPGALSKKGNSNHEEVATSLGFQTHLVDLYFTYQNPALPIVQKDAFMDGWARQERTPYFSSFLLHCMLARSARLSDHPDAIALIPVYHNRIKSELLTQIEDPSIATIHALCLYGHFLGSMGDDRGCWLYPGTLSPAEVRQERFEINRSCARHGFSIGIRHGPSSGLFAPGPDGQTDSSRARTPHLDFLGLLRPRQVSDLLVGLRSRVSAYAESRIYSVCQGRPSAIKIEEVGIPRPSEDTVGPQQQLLTAWVDLSFILDEMNSILNGPPGYMEKDAVLKKLSTLADDLLTWLRSLPSDLRWDRKNFPAPEVCALHTQVLTAIVLVHRPFANSTSSVASAAMNGPSKKQLPGCSTEDSRNICTQTCIRIAKMIDAFRRQFGIQKMFSVGAYVALTAAMTLVTEVTGTCKRQNPTQETKKALDVCVDALRDLGTSLPVAGRHHTIIRSILQFCGYQHDSHAGESTVNPTSARPLPEKANGAQVEPSPKQHTTGREHRSAVPDTGVHVATQAVSQIGEIGPSKVTSLASPQQLDLSEAFKMAVDLPWAPSQGPALLKTHLSCENRPEGYGPSHNLPIASYMGFMQNGASTRDGPTAQDQQIYDTVNGLDFTSWHLPQLDSDSWTIDMDASSSCPMFLGDAFDLLSDNMQGAEQLCDTEILTLPDF